MAATTGFTPDFLGSMKTCILAIMWPRKDIQSFFARHGCEKKDVEAIASEANRSAMVDAMFARLEDQADGGLGPLRAMLQSLINWSYFDPLPDVRGFKLSPGTGRPQSLPQRQTFQ